MRRLVVTLCIISLAAFALPAAIHAQTVPTFLLSIGPTTTFPDGIAVEDGLVHAFDEDGGITVYTTDGAFVRKIVTPYVNSSGITIDADGNYLIADLWGNSIHKLSSDGTLITSWGSPGADPGQFTHPFDVQYSAVNGRYYVSDQFNGRIQMFTTSGDYIGEWGSLGTDPGQFYMPYGIGIDPRNGNIAVVENNAISAYRVQVFTADGTLLFQFGSPGTGDGQFNHPLKAAIDNAGTIYVTDKDNDRVQMFSETGSYVGQFGTYGTGDGQFRECYAIAADQDGNVYATDHYGKRIEKFGVIVVPTETTTWGYVKALYR